MSLTYELNDNGTLIPLTVAPGSNRLSKAGDFNIDIDETLLIAGANTVEIVATDNLNNVQTRTGDRQLRPTR